MESLLTPSKLKNKNLKLEELAVSRQTRESRWLKQGSEDVVSSKFDSSCFDLSKMQDLISEQEQAKLEMLKISQNKSLSNHCKVQALNSVRSLSKTIEDLLNREKMKISGLIETKLGVSKQQSFNLSNKR